MNTEPTIYKPSIYNGAGGIYKGRGIYNDGSLMFVEIGGRKYHVVKIGNLFWTSENLDFKIDGITIGGSTNIDYNPHAWYYNNDENTHGVNGDKFGLLYNGYCVNIINNSLPNGWRVPNKDDLQTLFNISLDELKINNQWLYPGTNKSGFSAIPSGYFDPPNFGGINDSFFIWSKTLYEANRYNIFYIYNGCQEYNIGACSFWNCISIRLCKDA
jgi:uncharacterized protein (TIGR02145 family)